MTIYPLIIIKSDLWTINRWLGLGHETMICVVCLAMFFMAIRLWIWCHINHITYSAQRIVKFKQTIFKSGHDFDNPLVSLSCYWHTRQINITR